MFLLFTQTSFHQQTEDRQGIVKWWVSVCISVCEMSKLIHMLYFMFGDFNFLYRLKKTIQGQQVPHRSWINSSLFKVFSHHNPLWFTESTLLNCSSLFTHNALSDDLLYSTCQIPGARRVFQWCNSQIQNREIHCDYASVNHSISPINITTDFAFESSTWMESVPEKKKCLEWHKY